MEVEKRVQEKEVEKNRVSSDMMVRGSNTFNLVRDTEVQRKKKKPTTRKNS